MTLDQAKKLVYPWWPDSSLQKILAAAQALPPHLQDPEIIEACKLLIGAGYDD